MTQIVLLGHEPLDPGRDALVGHGTILRHAVQTHRWSKSASWRC